VGLVQQGSLPDTLLLVEVRPSGQSPCLFMDPTAGLGLWANSELKLRLSGAAVYDHWVRDHLPPPPPPTPALPCLQHAPVFTIGKRGTASHLLTPATVRTPAPAAQGTGGGTSSSSSRSGVGDSSSNCGDAVDAAHDQLALPSPGANRNWRHWVLRWWPSPEVAR
jgi:hypothetical protein